MRFKASHIILIVIICLGTGVVMGALFARAQGAAGRIPASLIVHCPDGFQIEFHGEFELANGDKMRTLFCEPPEPEPAQRVEEDTKTGQNPETQRTTPSQQGNESDTSQ